MSIIKWANGEQKESRAKLQDGEGVETIPDECKGVGWILSPTQARDNYFLGQIRLKSIYPFLIIHER